MAITVHGDWLKERRDLYVRNIVKDFFQSYDFFQDLERKFKSKGVDYRGMDQWVGTEESKGILWQLKDLCHDLWKNTAPDENPDTFMFDWMIGTLFHEAMKLKENLYVLANYRPSYDTLYFPEKNVNGADSNCPSFFKEINDEINRGIKRIRCLYNKALNTLKTIVVQEKDNALLIRYMLDEKRMHPERWAMKNGLRELLEKLFPDGIDEAYCIAGESYLEGSWYTEAKNAFEEALNINPKCSEARSALRILEKRLNEIAILLEKEYTIRENNH